MTKSILSNKKHPETKKNETFLGFFLVGNVKEMKYKTARIGSSRYFTNGTIIKDKDLVPVFIDKSEHKGL